MEAGSGAGLLELIGGEGKSDIASIEVA